VNSNKKLKPKCITPSKIKFLSPMIYHPKITMSTTIT
jgi:hypothetical protein